MKKVNVIFVLLFFVFSCAEEGQSGSSPLDCGEYGSAHDDHCHCDKGALYNGDTCVLAAHILNICEDHHEEEHDHEQEHDHIACLCPTEMGCSCEYGQLETIDGNQYCVPVYHN